MISPNEETTVSPPPPCPAFGDLWVPDTVTIDRVKPEVPGVSTYYLQFDDSAVGENYRFEAGQFNMLYLPGIGEAAISISSDPEAGSAQLAHTIRVAGNVTRALEKLPLGTQIALRGPFGSAWPMQKLRGRDVVIACGGIGLAPLRPVIYQIMKHRDDYGKVYLLFGTRQPSQLLYADEYDAWRAAGIEVEVTVDIGEKGWQGNVGVVPILFYRIRLDSKNTSILTCGPELMMRFVVFEALARSIPSEEIYLSMERNMSCAMGFCGRCQLGPQFICKDGPVFSYDRLEPFMHVEGL